MAANGVDGRPARSLRRDALANQEKVLTAALRVFLREGRHVPMGEIAAEAGVGVGTLYRRYPNRDALLEALTHRSFRLLGDLAEDAETRQDDAVARLDWWWDRVIDQRDKLVLPLHGGPPITSDYVRAEQARLHASLQRLLDLGRREGRIRDDVDIRDVILFGAREWDAIARRQKAIHIDGLTVRPPPGGDALEGHARRGEQGCRQPRDGARSDALPLRGRTALSRQHGGGQL